VGDQVVEFIDGHPFEVALRNAVEVRWSGILNAMKGLQQVGVVVLQDGHIAWAVSNNQTENFGSFLERIGMVPKDRLNEVVQKYRSLGKSKKLGTLLEETGLISHATLRECLKAHVSAALSSMMRDPGIVLHAKGGEMIVDSSLIFLLGEVCPVSRGELAAEIPLSVEDGLDSLLQNEGPSLEEPDILQDLAALPGYLYALVASREGHQVACHVADGVAVEIRQVLPTLLERVEASSLGTVAMGMGPVMFEFVQCEKGSLFLQTAGTESSYFLAVACDEKAKLGVVRHKMSELIPEVRKLTEMQ
jgi:predicted regulator of Ras-like GTPase activity (Roadblock/LC7/MglB family)